MIRINTCGGFPMGARNIFAWYKAGYTLPVDDGQHQELSTPGNVPGDLTLLVNEIVHSVFKSVDYSAGVLKSENIGDYSYEAGQGISAMIAESISQHAQRLSPYRAISCGLL